MAKKSAAAIAMTKSEDDWMVRRDLDTLIEAEKIEKDPKRMAKVAALAKEQMLTLASVASEGSDAS